MHQLLECLHLYVGCETNKGKFIGTRNDILIIQSGSTTEEYPINTVGKIIFLYLKQLSDLSDAQSKHLIEEGISIGRPTGYTFSNYAFLYLLSLQVDLFGLINAGFAMDIKTIK
jgi:hypothetical protein